MSTQQLTLVIEFLDGVQATAGPISRAYVADGVLHVHHRTGPLDEQHVGSWPLVNIRRWHTKEWLT